MNKKIHVYKTLVHRLEEPLWKTYTSGAIAYHSNLYTQILNGETSDELENWFSSEFESPAKEALGKATSDMQLTSDDWFVLIRFLAASDVRTPVRLFEHLKYYSEHFPQTLDKVLNDLKSDLEKKDINLFKDIKKPLDKAISLPLKIITEFKEGEDVGIIKVESYVGRSTWIQSIKYVLENTAKILHTHKWSIVKPARGHYWFTSDNPVVKLNYTNQETYDFLGGWGRNKGNIIFPISPEHAMFVQIGEKPFPNRGRLTVSQTIEFRKFIAENSHRMIFCKNEDKDVVNLKPRIVNSSMIKNEIEEIKYWHLKNADLEREFYKP